MRALDLFAGPGGFDLGARDLGIDPLGIEWDDAACATREAAGLRTLQADVATLDPADHGPCDLLIASPPCQAFSMAGKRDGERDLQLIGLVLADLAAGRVPADDESEWADPRSRLVTEPLRWVRDLRPSHVALEQVPPVLPLWERIARYLREWGYAAWTGVLSSERYGVPQTRKRAILMASLDGPVHPPAPTHQAYVPGEPAQHQHTLEGELLPWVSMAEALCWEGGAVRTGNFTARDHRHQRGVPYERGIAAPSPTVDTTTGKAWQRVDVPAPTVTAGGSSNGGPEPFGRGARERISRAYLRTRGAGMSKRSGEQAPRPADEPAPAVTGKARSDEWVYVNGKQANAAKRDETEPAPTVMFAHAANDVRWVSERPVTTVAGDPRIAQLGHKRDEANPDSPGRMENAVRVTIEQAAALQSFPPGHPWQGSRSKQFECIGNAVPPLLARAILSALLGDER